jgi:hypothetical protein
MTDLTIPELQIQIADAESHDMSAALERQLLAATQREERLREALSGLLADITEYQLINNLGGANNRWQVMARAALENQNEVSDD